MQHLARAADELPGDEERDEDIGQPRELSMPGYKVVFVAAVGVSRRVGVVLEQVDVAGDAFLSQPPLGVDEQALEDSLPRLVMDNQIDQGVALRGRVLRMTADVEVEPRAIP